MVHVSSTEMWSCVIPVPGAQAIDTVNGQHIQLVQGAVCCQTPHLKHMLNKGRYSAQ